MPATIPKPDAEPPQTTTKTTQQETLQEYVHSRGEHLRLDRAASVLRGVKLLGLKSRNGRVYREAALREAIHRYEGARVNVNHPAGDPRGPRDYRDRIGVIRSVELRAGQGLFGSLHFNPKHALAEQLVWDAEHSPASVGLSHNVVAKTSRDGSQLVVESIDSVQSVDLVADPATTDSLFESYQQTGENVEATEAAIDPQPVANDIALTESQESCRLLESRVRELERQIEVRDLLSQYQLLLAEQLSPRQASTDVARVISETFWQTLLEAPDTQTVRSLIEDRATAVEAASREGKSLVESREQRASTASPQSPATTDEFVAAIRR